MNPRALDLCHIANREKKIRQKFIAQSVLFEKLCLHVQLFLQEYDSLHPCVYFKALLHITQCVEKLEDVFQWEEPLF